MDEQEALPRREAALGVGLLGVLLLGLVGTIVIRIVHAKPRRGAAPSAATWASQSSPTTQPPVANVLGDATRIAGEDASPATPIPTVDATEASVAPASSIEADRAASEAAPLTPQAPEFVAPSSIRRQSSSMEGDDAISY
jgi:hypothetical protein